MMKRTGYRSLVPTLAMLAVLLGPGPAGTAEARDLAVDPEDLVEVELATVGINPLTRSPVVLLRTLEASEVVPIFIGVPEARAILMAMHGTEVPRPMTHDLIGSLLSAAEVQLVRVLVDDLVDGTYLGMLEIKLKDRDEPLMVDSRPSDALAIAIRTGATIHVAPSILQAGEGMPFEGLDDDDQVVTAVGITVVEASRRIRETLQLPSSPGVLVNRSTGTAAREGLNAGSLILSVNGSTPESPMEFLELVRATPEGEEVHIVYWFDGDEYEIGLSPDQPALRSEDEESQVTI